MPLAASLHEVHSSEIIHGVAATVRDGLYTYRLVVAVEALRELGSSDEPASMLQVFGQHAELIAEAASHAHRAAPGGAVFISSLREI